MSDIEWVCGKCGVQNYRTDDRGRVECGKCGEPPAFCVPATAETVNDPARIKSVEMAVVAAWKAVPWAEVPPERMAEAFRWAGGHEV